MGQVKIYGKSATLKEKGSAISAAIHEAVVSAMALPPEKKFHRLISLDDEAFIYPEDRSENYIIIEISMFEGRTTETKKALIRAIYANIEGQTGIVAQDVEITLFETPKENWGIRGLPGDELALNYQVEV